MSGEYKTAPWRYFVVTGVIAVLPLALAARIAYLQVLPVEQGYEFLQKEANARTLRTLEEPASRGQILDRNGQPLAVSTPVQTIWANPQHINYDTLNVRALAEALDTDYGELAEKFNRYRNRHFMYVARHLSPVAAKKVTELGIRGIYNKREYKRFYPAGEVAAHVVGFTNIDGKGQEGIELALNAQLSSEAGSRRVVKDLKGNIVRDVQQLKAPVPGKDVHLSIDMRMQFQAYKYLKEAMVRYSAKAGSVVVMDAKTGEVLAMANQPSYNPNNRKTVTGAQLRNRAITDLFEPGSTMKPFTVGAALASGQFDSNSEIDTSPGRIRVKNKMIADPVNYGVMGLEKIITKSSQVGTTKLALELEAEQIRDVMANAGLGQAVGSGFPGESVGVLPYRDKWPLLEKITMAYGYGVSTTALQLAQAYTAFANDGSRVNATLFKRSRPSDETEVFSSDINAQILPMLKTVIEPGGTATKAALTRFTAGGKTGTAHKVGAQGYDDHRYTAFFAGVAPISNPKLVAVVVIDEPSQNKYYGGEVAAPVFAQVMERALEMTRTAPDKLVENEVAAL